METKESEVTALRSEKTRASYSPDMLKRSVKSPLRESKTQATRDDKTGEGGGHLRKDTDVSFKEYFLYDIHLMPELNRSNERGRRKPF